MEAAAAEDRDGRCNRKSQQQLCQKDVDDGNKQRQGIKNGDSLQHTS
jgi:hypothetical protein